VSDARPVEGEFIATLAHELRTPLGSLLNALHLIRLAGTDQAMVGNAREVAERQARHMAQIIDGVLDVCRSARGELRLRTQSVDLADVVARAVEAVDPLFRQGERVLTVLQPPGGLSLIADACRLEQVLVNLLTNAAKYTDPGGEIALTVEAHADEVTVRVRDNGIGIAPELLPHIFEWFRRSDQPLSRGRGGLGIGLALAHRLVQAHGGTISAASAGAGQGSEFVVRLPRSASI
jgi:signal transduction histidine kinase